MGGTIHDCSNSREGTRSVHQSGVNEVPYYLFEGTNHSLNLGICFMVVLGGHPDLDTAGLHHL